MDIVEEGTVPSKEYILEQIKALDDHQQELINILFENISFKSPFDRGKALKVLALLKNGCLTTVEYKYNERYEKEMPFFWLFLIITGTKQQVRIVLSAPELHRLTIGFKLSLDEAENGFIRQEILDYLGDRIEVFYLKGEFKVPIDNRCVIN